MFKNTDFVGIGFGTVTVCGLLALALLSPVSASTFDASTSYLPAQIVNEGTVVESTPADAYGDTGLSKSFPTEDPASQLDATPQMYS